MNRLTKTQGLLQKQKYEGKAQHSRKWREFGIRHERSSWAVWNQSEQRSGQHPMGKNYLCYFLGACSAQHSLLSITHHQQRGHSVQDSTNIPKTLLGKKGIYCRQPVSSKWVTGEALKGKCGETNSSPGTARAVLYMRPHRANSWAPVPLHLSIPGAGIQETEKQVPGEVH